VEAPGVFHLRFLAETALKLARFTGLYLRYRGTLRRVLRDTRPCMDAAMTPVQECELDALELFNATEAARSAAAKRRRRSRSHAR
jgi:hypothetical protein